MHRKLLRRKTPGFLEALHVGELYRFWNTAWHHSCAHPEPSGCSYRNHEIDFGLGQLPIVEQHTGTRDAMALDRRYIERASAARAKWRKLATGRHYPLFKKSRRSEGDRASREILCVDSASISPILLWQGAKPPAARVDGPVQDSILGEILRIKAITEDKLVRL